MFLPINKQLEFISNFLNQPEFKGKAIINDNRMIPIISGYKKVIDTIGSLSSLEVILPNNIGYDLGKWYPKKGTLILEIFENLIKRGLEIDIEVVDKKKYNLIINKIVYLNGINISYSQLSNIKCIEKYTKIIDFNKQIDEIINNYLTVIKSDDNKIINNLNLYKNKFKKYIDLKYNLKYEKNIKFKEELIKYFLNFRIFEFKMRIKFYKLLQGHGYFTLDEFFNGKKLNINKINYYKNISIKNDQYIGKVHKVYNVISSKKMKKGDLMVAENTNPEFIDAFYRASFIAVETDSELSHAAITCKELSIPLALGAKNIFLATKNGEEISINTKNKIIYL